MTDEVSANKAPAALQHDPLPIHFFTLVLNGEPFIRHHIDQMKQLPFEWHWHIVEGVAALRNDTAWSVASGGKIPFDMQKKGLSIDGTTQYLDGLAAQFPSRIHLYRPPPDACWNGKCAMADAPLASIGRECLLWEIDVDELWTTDQFIACRDLFLNNPAKTAAYFWCHYFIAPRLVISTRGGYGNHPTEWLRAWRYRPGMRWKSHEPPALVEDVQGSGWTDVATIDPFRQDQTEAAGLVFQHYSYVTEDQIRFKESYFGYSRLFTRWLALQAAPQFPAQLRKFFPWVGDETQVMPAEELVKNPILSFPRTPKNVWWDPSQSPVPAPRVIIDGAFFQEFLTGIAQVWIELLKQWVADGFAENIILLDRLGSAAAIPGIRRYLIDCWVFSDPQSERRRLQEFCDNLQADVFISTYFTAPETTPTVYMHHDMIPEVFGWPWDNPVSHAKHYCMDHAAAFVSVSEASKQDLLRFCPHLADKKIIVVHNGVSAEFHPRTPIEIAQGLARMGFNRPYFLYVGTMGGTKNSSLAFQGLRRLSNAANFDLICAGGHALYPTQSRQLPPGSSAITMWFDQPDLAMLYCGATALLHPSRYEGFGMPVLEAMASACPVIACPNAAVQEVAGDAAMYVPSDDPSAMATAMMQIQQPKIRQIMIQRGLSRAAGFFWKESAAKIKELLLQVAQKSPI